MTERILTNTGTENQDNNKNQEKTLTVNFTKEQVFELAKFLRNNQENMPKGLENFYRQVEDFIYNSLSIEEALKFYS